MIEKTSTDLKKGDKLRIKSKKRSAFSSAGAPRTFDASLQSALHFEFHDTIEGLMSDLGEQEKRFLDQQSPYELNRYKALVKEILKTILDGSLRVAPLKRRRRDRADFAIVEEIDSKLLALSEAVTRNNKAFDLLKTVEEIRGLLLDLQF